MVIHKQFYLVSILPKYFSYLLYTAHVENNIQSQADRTNCHQNVTPPQKLNFSFIPHCEKRSGASDINASGMRHLYRYIIYKHKLFFSVAIRHNYNITPGTHCLENSIIVRQNRKNIYVTGGNVIFRPTNGDYVVVKLQTNWKNSDFFPSAHTVV